MRNVYKPNPGEGVGSRAGSLDSCDLGMKAAWDRSRVRLGGGLPLGGLSSQSLPLPLEQACLEYETGSWSKHRVA